MNDAPITQSSNFSQRIIKFYEDLDELINEQNQEQGDDRYAVSF